MKNVLWVLVCVAALSACASSSERGGYSVSAGSGGSGFGTDESVQTFTCPMSIGDCMAMARDYCGDAGYTRVMRPGVDITEGGMSPVGRRIARPDETRARAQMGSIDDKSMSIRCKPRRQDSDSDDSN